MFECDDDRVNALAARGAAAPDLHDQPLLRIVALRGRLLDTGDRAGAAAELAPARAYLLGRFHVDPNALVTPAAGERPWRDDGPHRDARLLDAALYFLALDAVRWVAAELNDPADARAVEDRLAAVRSGFLDVFWRGDELRSPGYAGEPDDRGHAAAVLANLLPATHLPAVGDVLARSRYAGAAFEPMAVAALAAMGRPTDAIDRLVARGSGGRALDPLVRHIAGIAATAPGFVTYRVRPQPGPLSNLRAEAATPAGPVRVAIDRRDPRAVTIDLDLPPGIDGQLELEPGWFPAGAPVDVQVDGRRPFSLWMDEPPIGRVLTVETPPGRREVTVVTSA